MVLASAMCMSVSADETDGGIGVGFGDNLVVGLGYE